MPKINPKKNKPSAVSPSRVIGIRLPDKIIKAIDETHQKRVRLSLDCPTIYTVSDHIRYLISRGLRSVKY